MARAVPTASSTTCHNPTASISYHNKVCFSAQAVPYALYMHTQACMRVYIEACTHMYVMHTVLLSTHSRWLHTSPITPSSHGCQALLAFDLPSRPLRFVFLRLCETQARIFAVWSQALSPVGLCWDHLSICHLIKSHALVWGCGFPMLRADLCVHIWTLSQPCNLTSSSGLPLAFNVVDELGEGGIYCRNSYGCKLTCGSSRTRVGGWWCYSSADWRDREDKYCWLERKQ